MIYPVGWDENSTDQSPCSPYSSKDSLWSFALASWIFSPVSFRTGTRQTRDSIHSVSQRKKITMLILCETHYIPEDMRKQVLFLPVQKSRGSVFLNIVWRTLVVAVIILYLSIHEVGTFPPICTTVSALSLIAWFDFVTWNCYCKRPFLSSFRSLIKVTYWT